MTLSPRTRTRHSHAPPRSKHRVAPASAERCELEADVLAGLWAPEPALPPRWFYDEEGSRLFEEITALEEYYPTRREREILSRRADEIADLGASVLVELGAGSSAKTRLLLTAFAQRGGPLHYLPIDICAQMLHRCAGELRRDYPGVRVEPVVANFHDELGPLPGGPGQRLALFLGGTIGNFEEEERAGFLCRVGRALAPGDHFVLGLDLVKDESRLVAAYDDAAGVTAAFNRNLIHRIRTVLGATGLVPEDFAHVARWDPAQSRIEMRLKAQRPVAAYFPTLGRTWHLPEGGELRTEVCRKFHREEVGEFLGEAGLGLVTVWTDDAGDYALALAQRHA